MINKSFQKRNKREKLFLQWTKTLSGSSLTNCSAANFQSVELKEQTNRENLFNWLH